MENYPNQVGPVSSHQPDLAFPSYTLFAPHGSTFILLIDMDGQTAHYWTIPSQLGSGIELLSNGNLVFSVKTGEEPTHFLGTVGGRLIEMNPKVEIVWEHNDLYIHHDFVRLDNGNILLNRQVPVPVELLSKIRGGIPGTEHETGMWTNSFQEITPAGAVVWEWLAYDHLDIELDKICPLCTRST